MGLRIEGNRLRHEKGVPLIMGIDIDTVKPIITLDSKIEKIFYERCCKDELYSNIMIEWINNKPLYCKYTQMIACSYGNYSRHDHTHSESILENIYAILGEKRITIMDIMDIWLLLHCAYAHDIGMPYTHDEALAFWKSIKDENSKFCKFLEECMDSQDLDSQRAAEYILNISKQIELETGLPDIEKKNMNKGEMQEKLSSTWPVEVGRCCTYLTSEFCRKNHAKRSEEFLVQKANNSVYDTPYIMSARLYKIVAQCSMVHGEDFKSVLDLNESEWTRESDCHPAFIAALLRLGDLLDIDNNRFDGIVLENYGTLPRISEIHKMKHEAITHMDLRESQIEIVAKSDDLIVCKCVSEWFGYIKEEVCNIIFAWGKIAPECLAGCKLTVPKLDVFYKEQQFTNYADHEFSINKELLIKLVIGRNLYKSRLDFIREYIQNSLDALKMKFWLDLEEGLLDTSIHEEALKRIKDDKSKLTPLDFTKDVFSRYGIDVICEWVVYGGAGYIEISVADRGIGIDEECIKAISNIGSSWKKRSRYRKHLNNMPLWLKPTGGFGIGMQSGFMVTDKVKIITRCDGEIKGRQITLHSTALSGRIEEQKISVKHVGTIVTVQIPYEQFADGINYKGYGLIEKNSYGDYFDSTQIMKQVKSILTEYISLTVKDAMFPITIRQKGFSPSMIMQGITEDTSLLDEIEIGQYHYRITLGERCIFLWRIEDAVLCRMELQGDRKKEEKIQWYYKGVRVFDGEGENVNYLLDGFSNIMIDIMGESVDECLVVDRTKFLSTFDYPKLLQNFIAAYFNCERLVKAWMGENGKECVSSIKKCYCSIFAYFYVEKEKTRNYVFQMWDSMKSNEMSDDRVGMVSETVMFRTVKDEGSNDIKGELIQGLTYLPEVCQALWREDELYIADIDGMPKEAFVSHLSNLSTSELMDKKLILNSNLYQCFSHFYTEDINFVKSQEVNVLGSSHRRYKYRVLKFCKNNKEAGIIKDLDIVISIMPGDDTQAIFWAGESYPELQVTSLPWGDVARIYAEVQDNKERHMVISPIRPMHLDTDIIQKFKENEDPLREYKKAVMQDESFQYLVNWVYSHQIIPEKYSKDAIRKSYENLLEYLYKNKLNS